MDGPSSSEGRLEIYHNGAWKPLCLLGGWGWGNAGANVACRQLGYLWGYALAKGLSYGEPFTTEMADKVSFPGGTGDWYPWPAPYMCQGTESRLEQCIYYEYVMDQGRCSHTNDVGVMCKSGESALITHHPCGLISRLRLP